MKTIGICLLIIAGIILWGLLSYWKFTDWQILDWIIIIFNVVAGIYILSKQKDYEK